MLESRRRTRKPGARRGLPLREHGDRPSHDCQPHDVEPSRAGGSRRGRGAPQLCDGAPWLLSTCGTLLNEKYVSVNAVLHRSGETWSGCGWSRRGAIPSVSVPDRCHSARARHDWYSRPVQAGQTVSDPAVDWPLERKIFWLTFIVLGLVADVVLPVWWALGATIPIFLVSWWVAYRSDWF